MQKTHTIAVVENATFQNIYKVAMTKKEEKIIIYRAKSGDVKVSAHFADETIWLTQKQIAELFGVNIPAVSKHLNNIYLEQELEKLATVSKMETVQNEGGRKITRQVEFYNLDAIISVGYRVNSKKATDFRVWATTTLRNYLTKGYVLNQKRLETTRENFLKTRRLLLLIGDKAKHPIINFIVGFTPCRASFSLFGDKLNSLIADNPNTLKRGLRELCVNPVIVKLLEEF